MTLVDVSHPIEEGMTTYPGLPGPRIAEHLSFDDSAEVYAPGTEFTIGTITMVSNTGTYLDTPGHRHRGRHDLAGLPLERCADLPTVVVDAPATGPIGPEHLTDAGTTNTGSTDPGHRGSGSADLAGHAVLLHTGWDRHWRTERYADGEHPFLTAAGARTLVDRGAVLVGIDGVNIDDTRGGERPVHTILLDADVLVLEHLTGLDRLPASGARLTAVPPAIVGMCTFPVRAFAVT